MTIIYFTEHNSKCYGVTFQNKECVKEQKFEDISNDKNTILNTKSIKTFIGESQSCDMTALSGAFDRNVFDGNTVLLKMKEECNRHRYVHIGGNMVCSFLTIDNLFESISNMGNNLISYSIALGSEHIHFLNPKFKFIRKDKIEYNGFLSRKENSVDP